MVKVILKKQPRQVSGPFTQAQLLEIKATQSGPQHHIHRPWKTGKTYPYMSTRQMFRHAPALFSV